MSLKYAKGNHKGFLFLVLLLKTYYSLFARSFNIANIRSTEQAMLDVCEGTVEVASPAFVEEIL